MLSWSEFRTTKPDLAERGEGMLYQFGPGLGFLATTRKDGGPRVHPVCPVLHEGELYLLILPNSPKRYDLDRDGRFALHSFPAPENDDEFFCAGKAERIEDSDLWRTVAGVADHEVAPDEVLFRLTLERALYTTWENPRQPNMRPVYMKWRLTGS